MDVKNKTKTNFKKTVSSGMKRFFSFLMSPLKKLKKIICKNEERRKLFNDIKSITLVLLCSFLFLFLWVNRVKLYPDNILLWIQGKISSMSAGPGYPCEVEGEKISAANLKFSDGNIITLSDTSLSVLNESANVIREEKHNFSHPCLKLGDIRGIIYDRDGKNFKIESIAKNIYSGTAEKNIIACAVSDNGTYAVVQQSPSDLAEMIIYNKNNKEKYRYSFSEYYISDISLNSAGTQGAACGISADNVNISSNIYLLDFKSETPKFQFKFSDNMITHVEYLTGGNILAIGDKYMSFINVKSKTVKNFSYGKKLLKFYDFNKDCGICCCLSSSVNETDDDEIVNIDVCGNEVFRTQTSESFSGLSHKNNRTLGLSGNKIISYNSRGNPEGYMEIPSHSKKIILPPYSYVYILSCNTINKLKIGNLEKMD
jgi:hypothetical protein